MGLDMFAYARGGLLPAAVDFQHIDIDEQLSYWRKHPDLHGWMRRLYRNKGGSDPSFNCNTVELTAADLDQLEKDVRAGALPETSGFFFGTSTPEDAEEDLAFIARARDALKAGKAIYYTSWW